MSGKGVFSHYFSKVQSIISGTCTATTKSQVHIYNNAVVHYFVLFIVQISVQKFFLQIFFYAILALQHIWLHVLSSFLTYYLCKSFPVRVQNYTFIQGVPYGIPQK